MLLLCRNQVVLEIATRQIETPGETAERTGMQVSFEKTEYMNLDNSDLV